MQILPALTRVFRIKLNTGRRFSPVPVRNAAGVSTDELERILYGMQMHEQFVARKVVTMAGQTVPVRNDTVGFGNRNTPCYLREGMQMKISATPLMIDHQGEILINVFDESDRPLAIRLSDYIQDIYVNKQGQEIRKKRPASRRNPETGRLRYLDDA